MPKVGNDGVSKGGRKITRRGALARLGLGLAGSGFRNAPFPAAGAAEAETLAPARPIDNSLEVLEVGPGKKFSSLTQAGAFMNSPLRWNDGRAGPGAIARMGFRLIISPGPAGYYTNDSGSRSRRWMGGAAPSPYNGYLLGPVVIEGEAGKPAPVLDTDGDAEGVLTNEKALFATGSCNATFRRLIFRGFRRRDGEGNYASVRLGPASAGIPVNSNVLFEDCEIAECDDGILGGAAGQSLTLRRCYFHDNGNESGLVHNVYFSAGDLLAVEDTLSTRCKIGHLLKSRASKTILRNTRLIGNGGTESACLDVPDAGVLDMENVFCEKSPGSDANWLIHYAGENQDEGNGTPFHIPSSIKIRDLTLVAPPELVRRPFDGPVVGFANQSGNGERASGRGSYFVKPDALEVKVFGVAPEHVGLPFTALAAKPAPDLTSPVRLNV